MPHFEPKNTLQQDLFLLAKGHYSKPQVFVERLDVAKMIIGLHIGITDKHIALKDVLHWMLEEFVKTGVILTDKERLACFLKQPDEFLHFRDDKSYHAVMCQGLFDQLMRLRVRENDLWICAVPECEVDTRISAYIQTMSAVSEIRQVQEERYSNVKER